MRSKIFYTTLATILLVTLSAVTIGWIKPIAPEPNNAPPLSGAEPSPTDIRLAVTKSLSLLQTSGYKFTARAKLHCASCHHNTITSMIEEKSLQKGITFVDTFKTQRIESMIGDIRFACNINTPDEFVPAKFIAPYVLLGMAAEKCPPSPYTDIAIDFLVNHQKADGSFGAEYGRTPLESGEIHLAALCVRAIQLYAAPAQASRIEQLTKRTRTWLETTKTDIPQELNFQLLGLYWSGSSKQQKEKISTLILSKQKPDGSWSQLPTMTGDAYATGQTLYALSETGMLHPQDPAYQKGIAWLLKQQDPTGAWIVETRAFAIQPFFTSDFPPYDENQYISATATSWSALALLNSLPDVYSQTKADTPPKQTP
ncbi:MAG: terpene cyclase/mutase family protein [Bacteroidetes bacterium]|nr:terpene cyclase/mutase family protein [Bacteroidota bacterium]